MLEIIKDCCRTFQVVGTLGDFAMRSFPDVPQNRDQWGPVGLLDLVAQGSWPQLESIGLKELWGGFAAVE